MDLSLVFGNLKITKNEIDTSEVFLETIDKVFDAYFIHGTRSSKTMDILHTYFKSCIELYFKKYQVVQEYNVQTINCSGQKRCDIVVLSDKNPIIVFPIKFIKTSYFKNKNNFFENAVGESYLLKKKNKDLIIIPINIITSKVPNLDNTSKIKNYETITYENSFKIYEECSELFDVSINYIIDVIYPEQSIFEKKPEILGFNKETMYNSFNSILSKLNLKEN